jgi:hypothetical protein
MPGYYLLSYCYLMFGWSIGVFILTSGQFQPQRVLRRK